MNAHLFRLVEGDENLFRDVRDRLIVNGIAADRSGVGLVRSTPKNHCVAEIHANQTQVASAAAQTIEEIASPSQIAILESGPVQPDDWSEAQWWVMKRGVARGPVNLIELCHLRQSGEIEASDVVRQGLQGLWLQVDEVPLLATAKPATRNDSIGGLGRRLVPASRRSALQIVPVNIDSPADTMSERNGSAGDLLFIPPDKSWNIDRHARPGWLGHFWKSIAWYVGGTRRLLTICVIVAICGAFNRWWQLPPPVNTIYREFASCRNSLQKVQDRRVSAAEWLSTTARHRPRIKQLVNKLQSRSNRRSPVEEALFLAGSEGLVPILESPSLFVTTDQLYEMHMQAARKLLEKADQR